MKDLKISKELIKNVFNYDIDGFQIIGTDKSTQLRVWSKGCEFHLYDSWDVHHFAFKCKEWAFKNGGYVLQSQSYTVKDYKFTKGAFCYIHFPMCGMGNSHWGVYKEQQKIKLVSGY